MCAGIEPGDAAAEQLDPQRPPGEIGAVDVGDLQLPAGGGLELSSELDAARVVEVKARDRVGRARRCGLLRQIDHAPAGIELHHPVALGIAHVVGEHRSLGAAGGGGAQLLRQSVAVEEIVAEDQAHGIGADEVGADQERFGDAARLALHRILHANAPLCAVAEQPLKERPVVRRADQERLANPGEHERGERIVDQRLVVDRQESNHRYGPPVVGIRLRDRIGPW